jgi:hypothetical protein
MTHDESERHKRFVTDGISKLPWNKKTALSPIDILQQKMQDTATRVYQHVKPILQAGGGFDKDALGQTLFKLYWDELSKYSKEEQLALCVNFCVDQAMTAIDANPSGSDKPDLLSGS